MCDENQIDEHIEDIPDNILQGFGPTPAPRWELITQNADERNTRFQRTKKSALYKIHHNISDPSELQRFQEEIDRGFEAAIREQIVNADPNHFISIKLDSESLDDPFYLPPRRVRNFNRKDFWNAFDKLAQSKRQFIEDGLINLSVNIYQSMRGGGRKKRRYCLPYLCC